MSATINTLIQLQYSFNLLRTNLNNDVLGTSSTPYFFQMIISSMHLLSRMNVMLDFICMGSVDLQGAHGKAKKYKMNKYCPQFSSNLEIGSQSFHRLS